MTIINPVTIKIFRARNPKKIRIQAKWLVQKGHQRGRGHKSQSAANARGSVLL